MIAQCALRRLAAVTFGLALLAGGGAISIAAAQEASNSISADRGFLRVEINSSAFGETRPVLIHLPANYDESDDQLYPVL